MHDASPKRTRPTPAAAAAALSPVRALALRRRRPARSASLVLSLGLAVVGAACSGSSRSASKGHDSAAAAAEAAGSPSDAARAPIVPSRYTPATPTAVGTVRGSVELVGDAPLDSVARPTSDQDVCGDSLVVRSVEHDGSHLADVVVWLEGVRSGKRLPIERRFDLGIDGCQMTPRVQAVLAGGTLDLHNADALVHRTRLVRQGTSAPVATATYSDEGQVVPISSALEKAGMIEVRCDVHPWARAWIAVFDHPYFRTTERDGAFTIDSVPPGTYNLVAWHPRLGVVRQKVRVEAGKEAGVKVEMKAK